MPVLATDPLYILYTSGTTGIPKGVVRDHGGHMVALKWSMKNLYGVEPGEVYWCASDVGWVVGHSYIVYAPLFHGCTTVLYEGKPVGTPDAGAFWRVISEHGAVAMFTAPTAFRAIKKEDPKGEFIGKYDLSKFRTLFLAGERADPDTIKWAENLLKVPVIDHWWQTETGWCIAGNPMGLGQLPVKHGSPTVPMPGYQVDIVDEASKPLPANKMGSIVIKLPMPPSCLPTLWEQDERFKESYLNEFPGYYKTADAGYKDDDGYVYVMGRTDDIINVAGHRLSTGGMEEVLSSHQDVAECAVMGIKDELKGEVPCGFIVLKAGVNRPPSDIEKEIVALVREKIGPVAAFKLAITVKRLPKTRSGKILRGTMKKIADGDAWKMPATIDDPAILDEIGAALKEKGVGAVARDEHVVAIRLLQIQLSNSQASSLLAAENRASSVRFYFRFCSLKRGSRAPSRRREFRALARSTGPILPDRPRLTALHCGVFNPWGPTSLDPAPASPPAQEGARDIEPWAS